MYINTNIASINAQRHLYQSNMDLDRSLERLSSGLRINSAADDASGLAIADKMSAQRSGMTSAIQNTQDSSALFKIAEGALSQVGKMLSRVEELTVRAANQTLTSSDRVAISSEINELINQIDTISNQTEYNTMKLLNGSVDIQTSLAITTGQSGSMKVLDAANTVKNIASTVTVTINAVGTAASAANTVGATAVQVGTSGTITVNNVDISVISSDTADTVVAKINAQNSKTGVVAVKGTVGNRVALITGVVDADAANVIAKGSTASFGSAMGYIKVGTAQNITINGNSAIWAQMGYTAALNTYGASGTNASVTLAGLAFTVTDGKEGTYLEMKNSGSDAYGVKLGIDLFNGGDGGFIRSTMASVTSAVMRISTALDAATLSINTGNMIQIQVGANYNQNLKYSINAMDSVSIGAGASSKFASLSQIAVDTVSNANLSLKVVQKAITDVADTRAAIGSILNRLDYTDKTLQVQRENMAAAESKIRDADISLEMTAFTRQQILMQAGTSMLAQANSKPQTILQLLK